MLATKVHDQMGADGNQRSNSRRWLSGRYRKGASVPASICVERIPGRWHLSISANQRKLELVFELEALAQETGLSLIELAIGFVLQHPGPTSDHRSP